MIDLKDRYEVPMDHDFNGFYRGLVVDVADPMNAKRVRVKIYGIYDNIPTSSIPWAQYADPLFQTSGGSGSAFVPDAGDEVWCFFENADFLQPVYFAGAPSAGGGPEGAGANTTNRVFSSKGGNKVELDDSAGNSRVALTHSSGSFLEFDNAGNAECKAPRIDLGESGLEPMVLGDKLAEWAAALADWLDNHQHNYGPKPDVPASSVMGAGFAGGGVYSTKNRTQ